MGTTRRWLLARLPFALCAVPRLAEAQQPAKLSRIGFLGNSTAALEANLVEPFREGLRELGYVEGQNVAIEYRWAEGRYERFPALIADLLARKVNVLVAAGTPAAMAVKQATTSTPLVMVAVGDPVGTGLVASLARPGANLTGLVSIAPDLEGKRLELLKEVVPKLSNVAMLVNPVNAFHAISEKQAREAASTLHLRLQFVPIRADADFEPAFDAIARSKPGGMIMLADRLFLHHRARIADFAFRHRIPAVYAYRELVEVGGLMSFGPSYEAMHRRAAYFVDRILRGSSPGELPMEQPTQFRLVLNLKTAKALALTLSPSLLLRADQVIE